MNQLRQGLGETDENWVRAEEAFQVPPRAFQAPTRLYQAPMRLFRYGRVVGKRFQGISRDFGNWVCGFGGLRD